MDVLREAAGRAPDAPAVEAAPEGRDAAGVGVARSYGELDAWADEVARSLVRSGVGPGDRVGMRLPPCPEAVVLLHAVPRAGGVLVPVNPGWTRPEVMRGLAAVGPPGVMFQTVGEVAEWGGGVGDTPSHEVELPGPAAGQPAAVLLTSGSTGSPRPVPISHRNLQASAQGAIERLGLGPQDRWLASLSPAHVGGLALLHRAAVAGSSVLTRPRFDAAEAAELIEAGRVSHASLVPVMLRWLLEIRGDRPVPDTLRCLLLGGAAVPPPLLERALALGYPVALTYGLTEATSQVATAPPEKVREKPGSVGTALPGIEVRIAGDDAGSADGASGEILVKGPTVVTGLSQRAEGKVPGGEATSRDAAVHRDEQGWLHTGDLGRFDTGGDLWVVGRLSERIVTAGVTVEPGEVEAALAGHPAIRDVAVVGVSDSEWGERVVAAIVAEDPENPPSLEDLQAFTRERLASPKRPRGIRVVDELPRNPNGKIRRAELRGMVG